MNWSVKELYQEFLELRDEQTRIEVKRGSSIGDSIMQTICAYANEPDLGGGYLLLGIAEPDKAHADYWLAGVANADVLLNTLQSNCRNQFESPITFSPSMDIIDGKKILGIYVPELSPTAKPCRFVGYQNKNNKRKTGVWRRGANGDYECTEHELAPILLAKQGKGYEKTILADAHWADLDPLAIHLYRQLRSQVKPHAEELQVNDEEMLEALGLIEKQNQVYKPNIAGLLLMGKPLALRRLLPAVRVDYVRINGIEWVKDPENRFSTTLDFLEPLLRLIPRLESTILDDMPRHFQLEEGKTQRSDQPLLPQKVIREAAVNALMHRDYQVNQPIIIARYSNRLEIRNPGYSLKPESALGEMGSRLRNPIIAAVLYDLNFAETKGSGIRTMRNLLKQTGLTPPVFISDRQTNQFNANYLLHQLLNEDHYKWLQQFEKFSLNDDEAKALLITKEVGALDNAGLRAVTDLDTLAASQLLRRLCQLNLIKKGGSGSATYYQLATQVIDPNTSDLDSNTSDLDSNTSDLDSNTSDLSSNTSDFPQTLRQQIDTITPKMRKEYLWPIILQLCELKPYSAEGLAHILHRKADSLKTLHLNQMRQQGLINYQYAEVVNHPEQAYKITNKGRQFLKKS